MATITSSDFQLLAKDVSTYGLQTFRGAKRIHNSGIVMSGSEFTSATGTFEGHSGTVRWLEHNDQVINTSDETATKGSLSSVSSESGTYLKSMPNVIYEQYDVAEALSNVNIMNQMASNFGNAMGQDLDGAVKSQLMAIATREVLNAGSSGGGQTDPDARQEASITSNSPNADSRGFYVDLNDTAIKSATGIAGNSGKLIDNSKTNKVERLKPLLAAVQAGFKDYDLDVSNPLFLVTTPSVWLDIKATGLIDEENFVINNLNFTSILNGAIVIVTTATAFRNLSAESGVVAASKKTSFLCRPGALSHEMFPVRNALEYDRDITTGSGGGKDIVKAKWGYALSPYGYSWGGATNAFAKAGTGTILYSGDGTSYFNNTNATTASNFTPVVKNDYKRVLPVLHA